MKKETFRVQDGVNVCQIRNEWNIPDPERKRTFHRLQIVKENGNVTMHRTINGFSREEYYYLYEQVTKGHQRNPLSYFHRLANFRAQSKNSFSKAKVGTLFEEISKTMALGYDVFEWETEENRLPTFDDLRRTGFEECQYQSEIPFNVDLFVEKVNKFVHSCSFETKHTSFAW